MAANGLLMPEHTLGIIYSVVARSTVVLACYASCQGNFSEVAEQVLEHIPSEVDGRLTYAAGDYMYHYICEGYIVFMCITDEDFERSKAFLFLDNIKRRFQAKYESSARKAMPYAMNSEFSAILAREMRVYSETSMNLLNTNDQVRLENIGIRDLELSESGELEPLELEIDNQSIRSLESYRELLIQHRTMCSQCCRENMKGLVICLAIFALILVIAIAVVFGICVDTSDRCGLASK